MEIDYVTRVWTIKVVPNAEPNADGIWVKTTLAQHALPDHSKFHESIKYMKSWCPEGYHIVSMALDKKEDVSGK